MPAEGLLKAELQNQSQGGQEAYSSLAKGRRRLTLW